MIEKPYPPSPGFAHYQFARDANMWRADVEAYLVECERPIDWADNVIALLNLGVEPLDVIVANLGRLNDLFREDT
jgi:hypothetical protein